METTPEATIRLVLLPGGDTASVNTSRRTQPPEKNITQKKTQKKRKHRKKQTTCFTPQWRYSIHQSTQMRTKSPEKKEKKDKKKRLVSLPGGDTASPTEHHLVYIPFSLFYPLRARGSHGYVFAKSAFHHRIHSQHGILNLSQSDIGRQT